MASTTAPITDPNASTTAPIMDPTADATAQTAFPIGTSTFSYTVSATAAMEPAIAPRTYTHPL